MIYFQKSIFIKNLMFRINLHKLIILIIVDPC